MLQNNCEIRVLVKDKPIPEYAHMGQNYVEGREGSQFEIEFINNNPFRVEAVLSVDGLSIIDGKEAGPTSSGYLVDAHKSVRIPGWKLSDEAVAAFVFAGKKGSYAAQATGSAQNTGVIGAMVFKEKAAMAVKHAMHHYGIVGAASPAPTRGVWTGTPFVNDIWAASAGENLIGASRASYSAKAHSSVDWQNGMSPDGIELVASAAAPAVEQHLGTAFGDAQDFKTETVSFERGDMVVLMVLYYDNARGLKARGVPLVRPSKQKYASQPQAFPGMNCAPPPGWQPSGNKVRS